MYGSRPRACSVARPQTTVRCVVSVRVRRTFFEARKLRSFGAILSRMFVPNGRVGISKPLPLRGVSTHARDSSKRYEASRERRTLGGGGTPAAQGAKAGEEGRKTASTDPTGVDRNSLHPADGPPVTTAATRDGLRERLNVLATVPNVDATRCVATTPRSAPARASVGRRDRLEPGRHRQFDGGGETGATSSGQTRRIKAGRAANAILWSTPMAFRSHSG
jgi:hypothetical protein